MHINVWPTLWNIDLLNQKLASNVISNFHQDLPVYPTNIPVDKMSFMSMFLIVCTISSINGQKLPDQKFVTDLVTNFNRFGIVLHLPIMKFSHIHDYYKSINQYKWVLREKIPPRIKTFLPQSKKKKTEKRVATIAFMPSLLCRSQILIGSEFGQYIPTVVHTVQELQLWTKEIERRHPSTKGSYCVLVSLWPVYCSWLYGNQHPFYHCTVG